MKKNFAAQPLTDVEGGILTTFTGNNLTTDINNNSYDEGRIFQKSNLFVDNCKSCNGMKNFSYKNQSGNLIDNGDGSYTDPSNGEITDSDGNLLGWDNNDGSWTDTNGDIYDNSTMEYLGHDNGDGTWTDAGGTTYDNNSSGGGGNSGNSGGGGGVLGAIADFFKGVSAKDVITIAGQVYTNEQQIRLAREQGVITENQANTAIANMRSGKGGGGGGGNTPFDAKTLILPIAIGGVLIIGGIATYFYFKKKKIS
jgi:hypothetical protein